MQCTSVEASAFIVSLLTYSGFSFNSSVPVASDRPPLFESLYEYRRVAVMVKAGCWEDLCLSRTNPADCSPPDTRPQ